MEGGKLRALVELGSPGEEDSLCERLLRATYRASVKLPSIVLLRGLTITRADQILDPAVLEAGSLAAGLLYLSEEEDSEFLERAPRADIVVATTEDLRGRLVSMGLDPLEPEEGIRALGGRRTPSNQYGEDAGRTVAAGAGMPKGMLRNEESR